MVRAISGHATTSMQENHSSVSGDEVRSGLAKVIALAGITSAVLGRAKGVMTTQVVVQVVMQATFRG